TLNFDQAYNFAYGDYAIIEISINGGAYTQLRLLHASNTSPRNWYNSVSSVKRGSSTPTNYLFENDNTSIDLSAYLGQSNVRIRWSFTGTTDASVWAMDNMAINQEIAVSTPVSWTDGIGDPNEPVIGGGNTEEDFTF